MSIRTEPHPIWQRLREDGRYNLVWLARRTGYSHSHVKAVAVGIQNAGPRFRAECARVLDLPESVLFHGVPTAGSQPEDAPDLGSDDCRASTAVAELSVPAA